MPHAHANASTAHASTDDLTVEPPEDAFDDSDRAEAAQTVVTLDSLWCHWMGWPQAATDRSAGARKASRPAAAAAPREIPQAAIAAATATASPLNVNPPLLLWVLAHSQHVDMLGPGSDVDRVDSGRSTLVAIATGFDEVARSVAAVQPRLVVIEPDALDGLGAGQLQQLRCRFSHTHWVIVWREPPAHWVEFITHLGARGVIALGSEADPRRAIEAVLAGHLWFPRWVFSSICTDLLGALWSRPDKAAPKVAPTDLTQRESDVYALVHEGLSNKEIARRLAVSVNTVKKHLKNVFEKRGMKSRRQALGLLLVVLADAVELPLECLCLLA